MREEVVKEQIQWMLLYIYEVSANVQKKNILDNLEAGNLKYKIAEEFLTDLRKEFGRENKEVVKVAELKQLE